MGVVCFYVLLEALDVLTGVLGWDILPKFLKTGIATTGPFGAPLFLFLLQGRFKENKKGSVWQWDCSLHL